MNEELIQQLVDQCVDKRERDGRTVEVLQSRKFAELIVFECTKAVMDGTKEGDHYAQRIEQHFDHGTGGVLYYGDGE